ncbi:MAG: methyltransferase domain-containing protein [Candidatus Omnitrophica bacterium]|nr:methyltransferase domain-containing protein [Candidatus Omnitrophota bacterium]
MVSRLGLLGLFFVSAAVIQLELLLIRATSVILWNHHTPLILTLALFGFGASGVLWASSRAEFRDDASKRSLSFILALLFSAAVIFVFFIFTRMPLLVMGEKLPGLRTLYWVLTLIALIFPFFFGGTLIGLWIIFAGETSGKVYGINLIGSGIGSLSYLFTISSLGASGSVFFVIFLLLAGAVCFSMRKEALWQATLSLVLLLASMGAIFFGESLMPVEAPVGKRVSKAPREAILYTGWNTLSRVDVMPPGFEGTTNLTVLIDGGAATTYIPRIEGGLDRENPDRVRSGNPLIHRIKEGEGEGPSILVVGSGGGIDVRDFLVNGASRVTAVEINPLMNELVRKRFRREAGNLYQDPRVRVITGDVRSFLSKTDERFDIIHLGLPITNAALASGAVNLSENTLLTEEALGVYFSHLVPGGIFYLYHNELSALRTVVTAARFFREKEFTPLSESVVALLAASNPEERPITGVRAELLIKKGAFSFEELKKVRDVAKRYGFTTRYLPGEKGESYFHRFFDATLGEKELKPFPDLLRPPTDERPYFFHLVTWREFFRRIFDKNIAAGEGSLLLSLALVLVLIFPFILFSLPRLAKSPRRDPGWLYLFAGTSSGFGFMLLEFVLLSWLRILWGNPETAAMIILSVFLVSAGLGSLSVRFLAGKIPGFILMLGGTLFLFCFGAARGMPELIRTLWAASESAKIFGTLVVLTPFGFVIGMPFAWLLERLSRISHLWSGWAWVYNIFSSSLGSILGFMVAMDYGYSMVFGIAAFSYAVFLILICFSRGWGPR